MLCETLKMGPYSNDPETLCLYTPPQKLAWPLSQEWVPRGPYRGELGSPQHSLAHILPRICSPERCPQGWKVKFNSSGPSYPVCSSTPVN